MVVKQTVLQDWTDLPSNIWWQRSTNHVKFTEKLLMVYMEKHVWVKKKKKKKKVCKYAKHGFATELKKTVQGVETYRLSGKEKVQWSVKKMMLTVFWHMKGPIIIDFLEKDATINSVFYCEILRQNFPYLLNDSYISCSAVYMFLLKFFKI